MTRPKAVRPCFDYVSYRWNSSTCWAELRRHPGGRITGHAGFFNYRTVKDAISPLTDDGCVELASYLFHNDRDKAFDFARELWEAADRLRAISHPEDEPSNARKD